jgi:hypothetical protein
LGARLPSGRSLSANLLSSIGADRFEGDDAET